jgi:hypothetical protein
MWGMPTNQSGQKSLHWGSGEVIGFARVVRPHRVFSLHSALPLLSSLIPLCYSSPFHLHAPFDHPFHFSIPPLLHSSITPFLHSVIHFFPVDLTCTSLHYMASCDNTLAISSPQSSSPLPCSSSPNPTLWTRSLAETTDDPLQEHPRSHIVKHAVTG